MNTIEAIQFYEGDVKDTNDFLYCDSKAYVTFNAMFFEGIENEQIKRQENKHLNPQFLTRHEEIYGDHGMCHALFTQMQQELPHPCYQTTRVERLSDFLEIQKYGRTIAFTSTSLSPFLKEYGDKKGIVLLDFEIPEAIPCINFANALPHYEKTQEAEVLLPPFITLQIEEVPLLQEETLILDQDKKSPVAKYKIKCTGIDEKVIASQPITDEMIQDSVLLYQEIDDCTMPTEKYIQSYLRFKRAIQSKTKEQLIELLSSRKNSK